MRCQKRLCGPIRRQATQYNLKMRDTVKMRDTGFPVRLARADPKEIHGGVSIKGAQLDSPFELCWSAPGLQFLPTARIAPHGSLGAFHPQAMA